MSHWDDEHCLLLIEAYRKQPMLWDPKHLNYYNKERKSKCWSTVADTMGCSTDEVKRKMANLLASFRREKKKMKTTCVGAERYVTRWYAFKPLSFMLKIKKSGLKSTIKKEVLDDEEIEQALQDDYYYSEEYETSHDMDTNSREGDVISQEHDANSEEYVIPEEKVPDSHDFVVGLQESSADSQDYPEALQENANKLEECDVSANEYDVNLEECDVSFHEYDDHSENNAVNSQKIENHETKIELSQRVPKPKPANTLKRKIKKKLPELLEDRRKVKEPVEIENDAVTKRLQSSDGQHEAQQFRVTKSPQLVDEYGHDLYEPHDEGHKLRVTTKSPHLSDECGVYGQHVAHKLRSYSNKTKNIVQHQINMILFSADMGQYDRINRHPPLNSYYPPPFNHR